MNENLYTAHKKLPHKTLRRVHSVRYTQCIHVSSGKLKLPKDTHTKKYRQLLGSRRKKMGARRMSIPGGVCVCVCGGGRGEIQRDEIPYTKGSNPMLIA